MTPLDAEEQRRKAEWQLFELRHQNLLSISKAQKVHLTTLLIEMTLLWVWYLSGAKDVTAQGVPLSPEGVWLAVPGILTFFSLALIGSINAALPAHRLLQEAAKTTIQQELPCQFAFYDLDTDKNVLDYFTFLKLSTRDDNFDQNQPHDPRNFFYPIVLLGALFTTAFALFHVQRNWMGITYSATCMVLQLLFVCRPLSRAVRRFRGTEQ